MRKLGDYTFAAPDADGASRTFAHPRVSGRYRIRIYDEKGELPVVVCTEWGHAADDPAPDEHASRLAQHVWDAFLSWATSVRWITHRPDARDVRHEFGEVTFRLVERALAIDRGDRRSGVLHRADVESILGQTLDEGYV